jgi:hypothetical protein
VLHLYQPLRPTFPFSEVESTGVNSDRQFKLLKGLIGEGIVSAFELSSSRSSGVARQPVTL